MSANLLLEDKEAPIIWRGPIVSSFVQQLFTDVIYGDVDFMFIDMPPGTGDTDVKKAEVFINGRDLMEALYNVAEDLQNVPELNIELIDVFTKEELFNMWTGYNAGWLLNTGLVPGCTPYYEQQREVLDSIVSKANQVIMKGEPTVTLRFSHDSSVLPLAYLLGLKEARSGKADIPNLYKNISIDKIIPMAANIQIIFYKKGDLDDILVKFLLNENETTIPAVKTDCAPYYKWKEIEDYYTQLSHE